LKGLIERGERRELFEQIEKIRGKSSKMEVEPSGRGSSSSDSVMEAGDSSVFTVPNSTSSLSMSSSQEQSAPTVLQDSSQNKEASKEGGKRKREEQETAQAKTSAKEGEVEKTSNKINKSHAARLNSFQKPVQWQKKVNQPKTQAALKKSPEQSLSMRLKLLQEDATPSAKFLR
jgi:hypothetical protein